MSSSAISRRGRAVSDTQPSDQTVRHDHVRYQCYLVERGVTVHCLPAVRVRPSSQSTMRVLPSGQEAVAAGRADCDLAVSTSEHQRLVRQRRQMRPVCRNECLIHHQSRYVSTNGALSLSLSHTHTIIRIERERERKRGTMTKRSARPHPWHWKAAVTKCHNPTAHATGRQQQPMPPHMPLEATNTTAHATGRQQQPMSPHMPLYETGMGEDDSRLDFILAVERQV